LGRWLEEFLADRSAFRAASGGHLQQQCERLAAAQRQVGTGKEGVGSDGRRAAAGGGSLRVIGLLAGSSILLQQTAVAAGG
jgi:hypothetical protein